MEKGTNGEGKNKGKNEIKWMENHTHNLWLPNSTILVLLLTKMVYLVLNLVA